MTPEIAIYVAGALLLPTLAWAVMVTWTLRSIHAHNVKLMHMHNHADEFGFGTTGVKSLMEQQIRATNALVHYIKWSIERQHNKKPPPPIEVD